MPWPGKSMKTPPFVDVCIVEIHWSIKTIHTSHLGSQPNQSSSSTRDGTYTDYQAKVNN